MEWKRNYRKPESDKEKVSIVASFVGGALWTRGVNNAHKNQKLELYQKYEW